MNSTEPTPTGDVYHHDFNPHKPSPSKTSFWRKLGGGSLSISLIIHGVILAAGLILIIQVIPQPKASPPDIAPSGRGGNTVSIPKNSPSKRAFPTAKIASTGVADIPLPPSEPSTVDSLPNLTNGSLGSGLEKTPAPSGGLHPSNGLKPGLSGEGTAKIPVFGRMEPSANALTGTFYDLKQDRNGKSTNVGEATTFHDIVNQSREILHDFVKRGWNERDLAKFYQAPQKLYQTKIFMPSMGANEAPKAFGCEKEVQGSRWVVVYRGTVRPPKTGKYRFVGAGDDVLAIRFAGKMVFDYGYESATANLKLHGNLSRLKDDNDRDWKRLRRELTMPSPVEIRPQGSLRLVKDIGGLAVGLEFEANASTDYPIEILISEIPGGLFAAYLMIEEVGATYQKDGSGSPILPVFRLDSNPPPSGEGSPVDPDGSVWKLSAPGKPPL